MSARDDYPDLLTEPWQQREAMCDEIDRLQAEIKRMSIGAGCVRVLEGMVTEYRNLLAALPSCPSCGATMIIDDGSGQWPMHMDPCPDCVDGKVSVPWMAATFDAVFNTNWHGNAAALLEHLRSVRAERPTLDLEQIAAQAKETLDARKSWDPSVRAER